MLSFVVPAHNEQACLGRTVQAIHAAARATGRHYEVIVVDDASTDATAEVARKHDATVVSVNRRQIAATRNAGGIVRPWLFLEPSLLKKGADPGADPFFGPFSGC